MKQKITVSSSEIKIKGEITQPGRDHLEAQQKYRSTIQKNKKVYSRKSKYKKQNEE